MRRALDETWRALNYLCAAQLYLRDNVLLRRPLRGGDLKGRFSGHWGTAPGVNFALAHLSFAAKRTSRAIIPLLGTGHAATSLLAWLYIENTLGDVYPELQWSRTGIRRLIASFGGAGVFRTELSAFSPATMFSGGDLGGALSFAQGLALCRAPATIACIVGDGELETGPAAAALVAARELDLRSTSQVLVVVNLNEMRMSSSSILGRMSDQDVRAYFSGLGYRVAFTGYNHAMAASAFLAALRAPTRTVLVVRGPKGFTFTGGDERIVGTPAAHKAPFQEAHDDRTVERLAVWLGSYRPLSLFDDDGRPSKLIRANLPRRRLRIGRQAMHFLRHANLRKPERVRACADALESARSGIDPMTALATYLRGLLATRRALHIFSPDESVSNRVGALAQQFPDRFVEVLSEDVCQGWMEGCAMHSPVLMITYEAFAARCAPAVAQYIKYVQDAARLAWRPRTHALNYVLTSLGWHNVYTHQNPDFVATVVARRSGMVSVFYPPTARRLVARTTYALNSRERVNIIVASKYALDFELDEAVESQLEQRGVARLGGTPPYDTVFIACGDVALSSVLEAARLLRLASPRANVHIIIIEDLATLSDPTLINTSLLNTHTRIVIAFVGWPSTIDMLIARQPWVRSTCVAGYRDCTGTDYPTTLENNGLSPARLADLAGETSELGALRHTCERGRRVVFRV